MVTDTGSKRSPDPAAALHRLRSILARLKGELELAELDERPPGGPVFGAVEEAFEQLTAVEALALQRPSRVFVLDDDERLADLVATRLRRRGFEVVQGADVQIALASLRPGDRLVVDYGLVAGLAGVSADSQMLDGAIVVSGAVSDAAREHALRLGAIAYLVKPVEMDALVELLLTRPGGEQL